MGATGSGKVVDVRDYGAAGNGTTDDTSAIETAIAALQPGDTLSFPGKIDEGVAAVYLSGPLSVSNLAEVTVELAANATLLANRDAWSGSLTDPFLTFEHVRRLRLTGGGVIDCNGAPWPASGVDGGPEDGNAGPSAVVHLVSCGGAVENLWLRRPAHISIEVDGHAGRGDEEWSLVIKDVDIDGGWTYDPDQPDEVPARLAGIALSNTEHVLVEHCSLVGLTDDNLVVKEGCKDLLLRHIVVSGTVGWCGAAASVGTEVAGTRHVTFSDIVVNNVNDAIHLKPLTDDDATLRDVTWQRFRLHGVGTAITIDGVSKSGHSGGTVNLESITFSDIRGTVNSDGHAYEANFDDDAKVNGELSIDEIVLSNGTRPWQGYSKWKPGGATLQFKCSGMIVPGKPGDGTDR